MGAHWQNALASAMFALYLFILATWHGGSRPRMVSGFRDIAMLTFGIGGLLLFGPFGQSLARLLFGKPGTLAWVTLAAGMSLIVVLLSRRAWHRLVIYHVAPASLEKALREVLDQMPGRFVTTLHGYEDTKRERGLWVEVSPKMKTATIEAYGHDPARLIQELEPELKKQLAQVPTPSTRIAWLLLGACAVFLLVPSAAWLLHEPHTRDAFRALFERLSGAPFPR
jgi:hypothetical protein